MPRALLALVAVLSAGLLLTLTPSVLVADDHAAEQPDFTKPDSEAMNAEAPETYDARFETSEGAFVIRVHREWAPKGADRFYNLVRSGYYDNQKFFRYVPGFVVQWGIHGDPSVSRHWREARIEDDPIREDVGNTAGRVVFANAGPNTRTTQLFINLGDNAFLNDPVQMRGSVFAPFGEVVEGMDVVRKLDAGYGERPSQFQGQIQQYGNDFLDARFPELRTIETAEIVEPEAEAADDQAAATQPSE